MSSTLLLITSLCHLAIWNRIPGLEWPTLSMAAWGPTMDGDVHSFAQFGLSSPLLLACWHGWQASCLNTAGHVITVIAFIRKLNEKPREREWRTQPSLPPSSDVPGKATNKILHKVLQARNERRRCISRKADNQINERPRGKTILPGVLLRGWKMLICRVLVLPCQLELLLLVVVVLLLCRSAASSGGFSEGSHREPHTMQS